MLDSLLFTPPPTSLDSYSYPGRISDPSPSSAVPYRSGFATIIGAPNMGKSTLLNRLLSYDLASTNSRPQTTRHAIRGVLTSSEHSTQIAFLDTPGVIPQPSYSLQTAMMASVRSSIHAADLLLVVTDVHGTVPSTADGQVIAALLNTTRPIVILVNKIDLLPLPPDPSLSDSPPPTTETEFYDRPTLSAESAIAKWREILPAAVAIIPLSTKTGENFEVLTDLLHASPSVPSSFRSLGRPVPGMFADRETTSLSQEEAFALLPANPPMYPADTLTDRSERFIASEIIRSTIFSSLTAEVPYCCEVVVDGFTEETEERPNFRHLKATVLVERDSQKGILIGAKGVKIKELGIAARRALEKQFETKMMVELKVKVDKDWRRDEDKLRKLGYIE